jgi:hypothetical protein
MKTSTFRITILIAQFFSFSCLVSAQQLTDFKYKPEKTKAGENAVTTEYQFNGYTNYWHDTYSNRHRYGNLFKMVAPDVSKTILQSKLDVAEDMGVPGLIMQEGFINGLLSDPYTEMDQPGLADLESGVIKGNVLLFVDPETETGKAVTSKLTDDYLWPEKLKSHQYGAADLKRADAFYLENGDRIIFVVCSSDEHTRMELKRLIDITKKTILEYDLYKGWFGAETLLKSVTCTDGHPLEVIGAGMSEGNSWFVFQKMNSINGFHR